MVLIEVGPPTNLAKKNIRFRYSGLNPRIRTKRYEALNNKGAPPQAKTFEEFKEIVVPMLLALGPYSADYPILLYKVLRIMKSALGLVSKLVMRQCNSLAKSFS